MKEDGEKIDIQLSDYLGILFNSAYQMQGEKYRVGRIMLTWGSIKGKG